MTGVVEEQSKKLKSVTTNFNIIDDMTIPLVPNIADFTEKNDFIDLFKTAYIALVVNLESEKLILKNFQNDADDHKDNQIYGLEKIVRVDPIEPLKGKPMNSAFSLTTLHQVKPYRPFKFQCASKDERDLWIAMFQYVMATNKVKEADKLE